MAIFDLVNRQTGLRQKRWQCNASFLGARICKARNGACSTGHHGELFVASLACPGHHMFYFAQVIHLALCPSFVQHCLREIVAFEEGEVCAHIRKLDAFSPSVPTQAELELSSNL